MDYENWLHFAEADIKTTTSDIICHLSQNQSDDGQSHLFVIVEASKILPATSVASAPVRENLFHDWRKPITESSFVTDIIASRETTTHNVSVIYCSSISDRTWIIRFTPERTLRTKGQEFRKFMPSVGSVTESHFDSTINDLIVSRSGLSTEEFVELQHTFAQPPP